jgi:hypothetical protein
MFKCDICFKEYNNKRSLDIHKNRKNKCNVITPYKCHECNRYFKYNKNLQEHTIKQTCIKDRPKEELPDETMPKIDKINESIKTILESELNLEKKIDFINSITNIPNAKLSSIFELKSGIESELKLINSLVNTYSNKTNYSSVNNGTINENSHNNSNNVTNILINNFGQENLSYMDSEYFKNLIMNQHIEKGYVQLIKDIYLNKDHPENSTVKVENINNKYAHVYKNGKWAAILKADLKEQLHKKNYTILKMHYDKLKKTMTVPKKEETRVFLERDDFSDPHMMYVIDKIILLFYNDGDDGNLLDTGKINKNIV